MTPDWSAPLGADRSGGGFDRLPGVVLELLRAEIAERGMEPPGVVDLVDEARKVGGDVVEGLVGHRVDRLDLERLHEALGLGVVVGIAAPAHRADEAVAARAPGRPRRRIATRDPSGGRSRAAALGARSRPSAPRSVRRASIERLMA